MPVGFASADATSAARFGPQPGTHPCAGRAGGICGPQRRSNNASWGHPCVGGIGRRGGGGKDGGDGGVRRWDLLPPRMRR